MKHSLPEKPDQDRIPTRPHRDLDRSPRHRRPTRVEERSEAASFSGRLEAARPHNIPQNVTPSPAENAAGRPAEARANDLLKFRIHRSFERTAAQWRLFQTVAVSTPFQRHEWLALWHDMIGKGRGVEPLLIFGYDENDTLRLILPLGIQSSRVMKRLIWLGEGINDYNAPLIDAAFAATLTARDATRIWWHAIAAAGGADVVDLGRQPEMIGEIANPFAVLSNGPERYSAHAVTLGKDWDTFYQARRSSKTRQRARAKQRKLEAMGAVEFVWAESAAERSEFMGEILALKRRQLRDAGDRDPFGSAAVQAFLDHAARVAPQQSALRLAALKLDGEVIAAVLGLVDNHTFHYVIPVFRTGTFSKYSPGNILLHTLMAWSIEQGLTSFDFTIGDEHYKTEWAEHTQKLGYALYPLSARGQIAVALTRFARSAKAAIKARPALARRAIACERLLRRLTGADAALETPPPNPYRAAPTVN